MACAKFKAPFFSAILAILGAFENKLRLTWYNAKICCRYAAKI